MSLASQTLPRAFFDRPVLTVACELLGQVLVYTSEGQTLRAAILETEAYDGEEDQACHARRGKTPRVLPMYDEAGHAFIYLTYGMHWLLNAVTGPVGYPAAVLIRALYPLTSQTIIAERRRGQPAEQWCSGPGKLTRALGIDGSLNTTDLCDPRSPLRIETADIVAENLIQRSARIGIQCAGEPWISHPWRFFIPYAVFKNWLVEQEQIGVS